ncbi:response regulator [Paenibacillus septentrionalis]|uniref:Response regulator n=1 Tax=Paenibacillus septentrionalis TaxID=429342 RepID=A0ABW1VAR9_9BACL
MLNILIVDDEQLEREGMRAIIQRGFPEVTVELAKHGKAAVELVPVFKPDLIIMDIKMPIMNGLEAIELISAQHPYIRYIMVTAYDTFEYARQAIQLGVKDYILKPSKIAEIQATVGRVLEQIKQEKQERERQEAVRSNWHKIMPVVEADIVTQLLFDHVHEVHLDEMISLLGETFSWNQDVFVLVIRIQAHQLPDRLYAAVKLKFRAMGNGWVGAMSGGCLPIIGFLEHNRSFRAQAACIIRELMTVADLHTHATSFSIGVGNPRSSLEQVRHSYQEALLAAAAGSEAGYYEDIVAMGDKGLVKLWSKQHEKNMLDQLRLGKWEDVIRSIMTLIDQFEAAGMSVHQAQQHMLEGMWGLFYGLSEFGVETELPFYPFQIHSYNELRIESERMLLRMKQDTERYRAKLQPDLMHSIKTFIIENAHRELSLELISKEIGLSPFYISKLFKEHFGMGYIDFLTECRIEKAKKLIGLPTYSLKEIAYEVGFNDPNYFSKVFKKVCGMSPKEYRKVLHGVQQ